VKKAIANYAFHDPLAPMIRDESQSERVEKRTYDVFMRSKAYESTTDRKESQVVLDLADIPWVRRYIRDTFVTKLKMSDDHEMIGYTLDVGNTEKQTAGFKNMKDDVVLDRRIEGVGQIEFGCQSNIIFYTKADFETNRPYKVEMMDLNTGETYLIFQDDDETHYIDIGLTKDKKFLIIANNTKEDSEIWVIRRDYDPLAEQKPALLVPRVKDVKAHIDHLRDFFVTITTEEDNQN
jgi:protease II